MPPGELPAVKALMGLPTPSSAVTPSKRGPKEDPKRQLARLMGTIIDKLQILALRRPRALIIVAQLIDGLLKQQRDARDDDFDGESHSVHREDTEVSKHRG